MTLLSVLLSVAAVVYLVYAMRSSGELPDHSWRPRRKPPIGGRLET